MVRALYLFVVDTLPKEFDTVLRHPDASIGRCTEVSGTSNTLLNTCENVYIGESAIGEIPEIGRYEAVPDMVIEIRKMFPQQCVLDDALHGAIIRVIREYETKVNTESSHIKEITDFLEKNKNKELFYFWC